MDDELIPPQALDVERTVLGTLIVSPSLISDYRDKLPPRAFYAAPNQKIYELMLELDAEGTPVDIITLMDRIKLRGQYDSIGGEPYICELAECIVTSSNFEHYAKILIEKLIYREVLDEGQKLTGYALHENMPPEELIGNLERVQSKIEKYCDLVNIKRKRGGTVQRFSSYVDRIVKYKNEGFQNIGVSPGTLWKNLTEHYRPAKGMLNVITGIPGHGKSEFMDAIMVNLSLEKGWKWAVFSPENYPIELYAQKLSEKIIGKRFFDFDSDDLSKSIQLLDDYFYIIETDEDNNRIDPLFKLFHESIENYGVDGCILDPWNDLEQIPEGNETLTAFIGRSLGKIRRFARRHNIYQAIVAHPTKIYRDPKTKKYDVPRAYDISDSSNWSNKADNILTVYRDFNTGIVDIHVQKIKFKVHGKVGCISFTYDKNSGRYTEYNEADFSNDTKPPVAEQQEIWQNR